VVVVVDVVVVEVLLLFKVFIFFSPFPSHSPRIS
jgi:hypothetical protein